MTTDTKKAKAEPAPKPEAAAKDKTAPAADAAPAKSAETPAAAPTNYSRGEGQKPVTAAYKANWNAIFGKKNKKKKKR
jgi:hypothetical protein